MRQNHSLKFAELGALPFPTPDYRGRIEYARLISWLDSEALRAIRSGLTDPEDIAEHVYNAVIDAAPAWYYDWDAKGDRKPSRLEEQAANAAAWALENYNAAKAERIVRTACKAGKAYRRMNPWDLHRKSVRGLSKVAQARVLGVSTATIAIYRRVNARIDSKRIREGAWTAVSEPHIYSIETREAIFSPPAKSLVRVSGPHETLSATGPPGA